MKKIVLKDLNTKRFTSLIKRSASMDNLIFITINGNSYESTSYNKNKSALKSVYADLEKMCSEYSNKIDEPVKVQFSNANKLISSLALVGGENVNITIDIEDDNYAKKITIKNEQISLTIACADKEAVDFLTIPEKVRDTLFENMSEFQYSIRISDDEFRYIKQLFALNKDSVRIFFSLYNGEVNVSEIESTDENVRLAVNSIIESGSYDTFNGFDKLYSKKISILEMNKKDDVNNYLKCFNKQYFDWIDCDNAFDIEYHTNKIKFVSYDEETSIKTYVMLTPVRFA